MISAGRDHDAWFESYTAAMKAARFAWESARDRYDVAWEHYKSVPRWRFFLRRKAWRRQQPLWDEYRALLAAWRAVDERFLADEPA